jgi:hypothetical protein
MAAFRLPHLASAVIRATGFCSDRSYRDKSRFLDRKIAQQKERKTRQVLTRTAIRRKKTGGYFGTKRYVRERKGLQFKARALRTVPNDDICTVCAWFVFRGDTIGLQFKL